MLHTQHHFPIFVHQWNMGYHWPSIL